MDHCGWGSPQPQFWRGFPVLHTSFIPFFSLRYAVTTLDVSQSPKDGKGELKPMTKVLQWEAMRTLALLTRATELQIFVAQKKWGGPMLIPPCLEKCGLRISVPRPRVRAQILLQALISVLVSPRTSSATLDWLPSFSVSRFHHL